MRLCSLNVHMWSDRAGHGNVDRLVALLAPLGCDVVGLQEVVVGATPLERLARELGMHVATGADAWLGNALLSPHPLARVAVEPVTAGAEEGRCVVSASVSSPEGELDVAVTHLDPWSEDTRVAQLARFAAALSRRAPEHVVLGDFNAVRPADMPPAVLADVAAQRARHDREPPRGEVVARMDALGYVDLLRLARAGDLAGYADALAAPLAPLDRVSCAFGTRVDYAWASPALLARWRVVDAWHLRTEATDHAAVVVDLEPVAP